MLALILRSAKLQERSVNFIIQLVLLAIVFSLHSNNLAITMPISIIFGQIIHYSLIALGDIYEDDYSDYNSKYIVYAGLGLFFVTAIATGMFENEFFRLHAFIVIIGNLLGGKVDTMLWKVFFVIYLGTLGWFEFNSMELMNGTALLYSIAAMGTICLCERLSEKKQQAWVIHSTIFFVWALVQGAYFQEGLLFILGGWSYEATKLVAGASFLNIEREEQKLAQKAKAA